MNQNPLFTSFLRHQGHAVLHCARWVCYLQLPALKHDFAIGHFKCAEKGFTEFGFACAHQTCDSDHLAALYLDGNILYLAACAG